ncbi:MAG: T9SS type A sorting domain-containing protein [Bacteroidales bacterium]|jgi:hypothetical protein|nr:T9SS type A sorting domain-containing protein [Bacteroidales bacterium]
MVKRYILFALVIILNITFLNAQEYKTLDQIKEKNLNEGLLSNEEFFEKAELIIEGKMLGIICSYDAKGNYDPDDIYSEYRVLVEKVFKGAPELVNDTICMIRKSGTIYKPTESGYEEEINSYGEIPPEPPEDMGLSISRDFSSILFFVRSDYPGNPDETKKCNYDKFQLLQEKEKASLKFGDYSWGAKSSWRFGKITGLNDLVFNNREELYEYMKQFKGITIPESKAQKPLYEIKTQEQIDSLMKAREKRLETAKRNKEERKKKLQKDLIRSDNVNNILTLRADNQQIIYNETESKYYFEFDILVNANNQDTYFDGALITIAYNHEAFGTFIYGSNKISIEFGAGFNSNNYRLYSTYDRCPNCFDITFGTNLIPPYNRVLLDTVPVVMLHYKIEILPDIIDIPSGITFIYTDYNSQHSTFSTEINSDFSEYENYDSTYYINPSSILINTIGTNPVITTDLSSITKIAGVGDTLVIRGYNFGNTKGILKFSTADDGGQTFLNALDDQYYIEWTDTVIKVIVPSLVYKGYEDDPYKKWSGGAGTGPIRIITTEGDSCTSNVDLNIPYSITNHRYNANATIKRVYLARKNCEYDFVFTMHENYRDDAVRIETIETALDKWSELTGLSLVLERDASDNLVFVNSMNIANKNIIGPRTSGTGVMGAVRRFSMDIIDGDTVYFRDLRSHILIKDPPASDVTWNYSLSGTVPAGEASFYHAFLHELGHILLLEHVNHSGELMYYSIDPYVTNNIIEIDNNSVPVYAVNRNINESRRINWSENSGLIRIRTEKPYISIMLPGTPVICNGEEVILTSNYTDNLLWSNGSTSSIVEVYTPGTYYLTVTEGHCSLVSDPVTITASNLNATFSIADLTCRNDGSGAITTAVTGNNAPFSYYWTGNGIDPQTTANLTGLNAGEYELVLADNKGCSEVYSKQVQEPDILTGRLIVDSNMGAIGTPIMSFDVAVPQGGVSPYSYNWEVISPCNCNPSQGYENTERFPVIPCAVKVTITDHCEEEQVLIRNNDSMKPTRFSAEIITDLKDQRYLASITGGTLPYFAHWESDCSFSEAYENSFSIPMSELGNCKKNFSLELTVTDFCGKQVTVTLSGQKSTTALADISIFPNPTGGNFSVSGVNNATLYLYSSLSEHIRTFENINNSADIDLGNLPDGIYFLRIVDGENSVTERIILAK